MIYCMIVNLLRKISSQLSEIILILRQPEDFTKEDQSVLQSAKDIQEAENRIPHPEQNN